VEIIFFDKYSFSFNLCEVTLLRVKKKAVNETVREELYEKNFISGIDRFDHGMQHIKQNFLPFKGWRTVYNEKIRWPIH
jgi:hypothetical protein